MLYSEFKEMCPKAWSEKINYLCFDMTEKTNVNLLISLKAKTNTLTVLAKVKLFSFSNFVSN